MVIPTRRSRKFIWYFFCLNETDFRIPIPDLVRKYRIQQVFVHAHNLLSPIVLIDDFVRELVKLNVSLHIFRSEQVLEKSTLQKYWKSKKNEYAEEGISVEMDIEEKENECPYRYWKKLKIRVSVMSFEQRNRKIAFEPPYSPYNFTL